MPRAFTGTYSPDGRALAYEEFSTAFVPEWYETSMWRHYRGGRTHPIRIMNLADYSVEKLPWTEQQRQRPDVDRQHGLLPLRPQLTRATCSPTTSTRSSSSSSRITTTSTS